MVEAAEAVTETHGTKPLRVGLDIGSTTVKAVVLDQSDALADALFSDYRRHHANVRATVATRSWKSLAEATSRFAWPSPVQAVLPLQTASTCPSFRRSSPKPKPLTRNIRRLT